MMPFRDHPHLYEFSAGIFVARLSGRYGRRMTVATVPDEEWERLAGKGFDLVWPMGVWRRSAAARDIACGDPGLRGEYDRALPGWNEGDVGGSPYAISGYAIEPAIGGPGDLVALRRALDRFGLGLILDFIPNHLAVDHPWVASHPERFVAANPQALQAHPEWFYSPRPGLHLAHGRDPWFPPWTDTAQINHFDAGAREALGDDLLKVAALADGVRCDMAMLVLDDVFGATWKGVVAAPPHGAWRDFWPEAIARVKSRHPGFLLIAETYREHSRLLDMGFDYVYDKTLYDQLRHGHAGAVRGHLQGSASDRFVRFVENHDEPRAAREFGIERSRAAATVVATSPGCRLFHDGQHEGRRIRLPVQLRREPDEPDDPGSVRFYDRLLRIIDAPIFHAGEWRLLDVAPAGGPGDRHLDLLACEWRDTDDLRVVVVNLSDARAAGRVRFPLPGAGARNEAMAGVILDDLLHDVRYERNRREIEETGLYVELGPWDAHIFRPDSSSQTG